MRTQLAIVTAALAGVVFATPASAVPLGTAVPSAKAAVIDTTAVEHVGRKKYKKYRYKKNRKWRRHHYGYRHYRPYRFYSPYYYGYPRYYGYYGHPYYRGYGYRPYFRSGVHIRIGW